VVLHPKRNIRKQTARRAPGSDSPDFLVGFALSDAVKVGFVPFPQAARGTLVIFCDDALKLGTATARRWADAANIVQRAAATIVKGKSGSTLDILAPGGSQGLTPDRGRRRQASRHQG